MKKSKFNTIWLSVFLAIIAIFLIIGINDLLIYQAVYRYGYEYKLTQGIIFLILGGLVLVYAVLSIKVIKYDSIGVLLFLENPMLNVGPGFLIAPLGFYKLIRESNRNAQIQIPRNLHGAVTKPIIITHLPDDDTKDVLQRRQTSDISIIITYKFENYFYFISRIGNKDELVIQLRDLIAAIAQSICSKYTVYGLLEQREQIAETIKAELEKQTKKVEGEEWGIKFISLKFENIEVSKEIMDSIRKVSVAHETGRARKIEGLTEAEVKFAFDYAKAEGYKTIAEKLNIPEPKVIYQIETLASIYKKNPAEIQLMSGDMVKMFEMITGDGKKKLPEN